LLARSPEILDALWLVWVEREEKNEGLLMLQRGSADVAT
jgi:hypothetical protein